MSTRKVGYAAWTGASPEATIGETVKVGGVQIAQSVPTEEIDFPAYDEDVRDLASGDNTITLPYAKTSRLHIIPPDGNTTAITLKGAGGDTGIALDPEGIQKLAFSTTSPPSSIILNAGAAISAVRLVWF